MPTPEHAGPLPEEVVLDEQGCIAEDIDCRSCGYDLRGLALDGRCPECGTAVGRSIHGDLLRFSEPAWVRGLANGVKWLIIAVFAGIGLGVLGSVVDSALANSVGSSVSSLVASMIHLVGMWLVTEADPGANEGPGVTLRRATRWLAVIGVGTQLLNVAASGASGVNWAIMITGGVSGLTGLVGALLLFLLMIRYARRVPDDKLARSTRTVMVGTIAFVALLVVFGVITVATVAAAGGAAVAPAVIIMCGAAIGALVFWIWWIVLLFQYRRALNDAATQAERSWAQHRWGAEPRPA